MAIEQARGCGYRKVGGLYLCGGGPTAVCDRLPFELIECPVCGGGIKFTRGFQWVDWDKYAGNHGEYAEDDHCYCINSCPVCYPDIQPQPYGLLWVGEATYTPQTFIMESVQMGVSRRIPAVPKNLKLGVTWVLLAHRSACGELRSEEPPFGLEGIPGIFSIFRPQTAELLIWESEATEEKHAELERRGITPIIIPDGDVDHDPNAKAEKGERARAETSVALNSLANKLTDIG